MKDSTNIAIRKFMNRAVFTGVLGMAVAFLYAAYLPKEYRVAGKIVVFPAGSASAQKNLGYEVGNTVEILNSFAFQEEVFQNMVERPEPAEQSENSSTIEISFFVESDQIAVAEDAITKAPGALAGYTRDIYEGSPFRYKLLADPETSPIPVRPSLPGYLLGGFGIGVLAYFLYWLLFEFLRVPKAAIEAEKEARRIDETKEGIPTVSFQPEFPAREEEVFEKKVSRPEIPSIEFPEPDAGKEKSVQTGAYEVPENLPVAEMPEASKGEKYQEPTDEEVKDRLNKLMRGEL